MSKIKRTNKGTFQRTSKETEQKVIELYLQGQTRKTIAAETDVGKGGVRNILLRNHISLQGMPPTHRYPVEKHHEAIKLYQEGKGQAEVAKIINIPEKIVKNWINKSGVTKHPLRRTPQNIKDEIIRLYIEEQMTAREIGARLGMSEPAVGTHLSKSGKRRTISEAQSLAANKRPFKKGRGGYWQSTKTGKWVYAMSVMEMLRMQQLDQDPDVKWWGREVPTIQWDGGIYVPDLIIEYSNGTVVVEEIKPSSQQYYEENKLKWEAARTQLPLLGMSFRIVQENELGGEAAIRSFDAGGLQAITPEEKRERKKKYYQDYYQNTAKLRRRTKNGRHTTPA